MSWRGLIALLLLIIGNAFGAGKLTISGYIIDSSSGETIIGVNVIVRGTTRGAASDVNGYFVIPGLSAGNYTLDFRHIAYEKKSLPVKLLNKSLILQEIPLKPNVLETQGVSIVAERSEFADPLLETGHRVISQEAIRRIPTSRSDVFGAIKFLPGVEGIDPISPLYAVRGSDTGENLILLDGVTIYNPYHYVSSSGLFNIYAIKNVELMVGGFDVEFGGRNSSVLYITTREGNNQKLRGEIAPGTTHTKAVVDFPLNKNATMMISGRYYYDLFSRFLFDAPSHFYDLNASLNWKIGTRHRLMLRYFHSQDQFDFKSDTYLSYLGTTLDTDVFEDYDFRYKTKWRNQAASAVLKTIVTPDIYWQTQVYYSAFKAKNLSLIDFEYTADDSQQVKLFMESDIRGQIQDDGVKSKLDVHLTSWNQVKLGSEWNQYRFENEVLLNRFSEGKVLYKPDLMAGFLEDKLVLGLLSVRPGIRFSRFGNQSKWNPEFRINAAWQITDRYKLKLAYGEYLQHIVSINTQEYELSQFLDNYYPLEHSLPAASRQSILGIEARFLKDIDVSLDFYHKDITRTYAFDYNASQLAGSSFLDKLKAGTGEAFGFELLVKGSWQRTSGWISYGWSQSTRQFPHIMNGKRFRFDYDRPHTFKAVLNHEINPNLEFSGAIRVLSGAPKTLETSYANYFYYDPISNQYAQWPQVVTPVKNNIRLPYYLSLDFGMKKLLRKGFGADLARYLGAERAYLTVSFENLLFALQRNVWFYVRVDDKLYGIGTNYIPVVSAGYSIQF